MKQSIQEEEPQSLLEQIVDLNNLLTAYKSVRVNNGAPGIDGVTVKEYGVDLEQKLIELKQEVLSWVYKPSPVKRVRIPKPGNRGERLLGIPRVRDRVLQAAIKQVLEPLFEPKFSENSYGFRPGRNQHQAVLNAQKIVKSGKEFVVDIDLSKFFDRINHDRLIHRLKMEVKDTRVLRLIGMILRSGVMENGLVEESQEGSVQGSPLSPLLSNIVLDELDKHLESQNLEFCRFADDCNVFVDSELTGKKVMESVSQFIETKLKLKINAEKSQVAPSTKVKFLGFTITRKAIAISKASMKRAKEKIRGFTKRRTHMAFEETVKEINSWYRGWSNYYKLTQFSQQLAWLEAHIRRRLRGRLVCQFKRKRFLIRKLRALAGTRIKIHSLSNLGPWALSNVYAVQRAWPNAWFHKKNKLHTVFKEEEWELHWFGRNKTPYLP